MDYEKVLGERLIPTYEELKSGLLRLIDEGKISREDAARVLPELRESEDERINKAIFKALSKKEARDVLLAEGVQVSEALAYLEKQKEYLHIPESCKENADSLTSDEPTPSVILDEQGRVFATQQKEPKPAWSEEDKSILEALIYDIERLPMQGVLTHRPCDSYIKFLIALRPSWKPSEEQIKALQRAIDACECEWAYQDDELRSLLNDLKKL